ncbi:MAG: type I restriction-modification system subunit M [Lachnospiraceae bacterium]|nr:type I restriction-modification system subunit M [Lachnospiraceae bacterium]
MDNNNIQMHQKELCNKLWAMANALRGNMEAYEFKNYILGMIFYYYLSDRTEKYMINLLKDDNISYENAWQDEEYKEAVVEESLRDLGFVIEPQYLFSNMVKMVENRAFDIEFLQAGINSLMESTIGNDSQSDFEGLFSDMQLDSTRLGHTVRDRSAVMAKIIAALDEINFSVEDTKIDVLGNAYEYLIGQFAATAGKKAGEFYTPSGPAELLCRLACLGLTDVKAAADPTCGSGSLLLRLKNYANVRLYYGQELTSTTYNLARMNMILRGIPYRNFEIYNGDTLEHDYFEDKKFRVQVANPPYSANWSADNKFLEDDRFSQYGKLAPKSKADFAFVQHMVYHMDEDGRAVVLLPHGVLFRGSAEETIRKYLIEEMNVLDAVIGLPANLFFGTGIPVCVLVLKKDRSDNNDNILFIDASKDFESGKNQNILRDEDIDKIVSTYEKREDMDKYAHVAAMDEIKENGFNLNIPRYVDTFEPEPEIDLAEVSAEIKRLQKEMKEIDAQLKPYFDELGLDFPFCEEV